MTRVKVTLGSAEAFAQLNEKDAPKATKWLKEMLPIERQAMHSMENGREVYVVLDAPHLIEEENQTIYQIVGDLIVYYKPAIFVKREWPRHIRDFLVIGFIYERDSAIRDISGPLATNLVGRITEGIDALAHEAPRTRREDVHSLTLNERERLTA